MAHQNMFRNRLFVSCLVLLATGIIPMAAKAAPPNGPIVIIDEPPNKRSVAIHPIEAGATCPGASRVLARFEVEADQVVAYESDVIAGGFEKVKLVVRKGHAMVDALTLTFRNGQSQTLILNTPIPRGHETAWMKLAGAGPRNIEEIVVSASDLRSLRPDPNFRTTTIYVVGCRMTP